MPAYQLRTGCAGLCWPGLARAGTNRDILLYDSGLRSVGVALRTQRTRWVLGNLSLEKMLLQPQADIRNHPRKDIQTDVDVAGKSPTSIAAVVPCEEEVRGAVHNGNGCSIVPAIPAHNHTVHCCRANIIVILLYYIMVRCQHGHH